MRHLIGKTESTIGLGFGPSIWPGIVLGILVACTMALSLAGDVVTAESQDRRPPAGLAASIPKSLPMPRDQTWLDQLRDLWSDERSLAASLMADSDLLGGGMPFSLVAAQTTNHVDWMSRLFAAYGVPVEEGKPPKPDPSSNRAKAYRRAMGTISETMPRYERLLAAPPDRDTARVLDVIVRQKKRQQTMLRDAFGLGMVR